MIAEKIINSGIYLGTDGDNLIVTGSKALTDEKQEFLRKLKETLLRELHPSESQTRL